MGKAKREKAKPGRSAPYDRHASAASAAKVPIFKFNTDSMGQHVLKNPGIADAIVEKANIKPTDTVLEVGPGTGNITVRLLQKARKVIAVELDPRMASEVTKRVMGTSEQAKLEIIVGDVIRLPELPPHDVLVSNTPYVISSPLVMKVLGMMIPPRAAVLMFQREFALRLIAQPSDTLYSRLSVNVNFWAKTQHIMKVGKNNFKPPPKVESDVVRIEPNKSNKDVAFEEFDGLLRLCFNRKNKTLRASWFQKEVLAMCEKNYLVWCAMNNIPVEQGTVENENDNGADDADAMDVEDGDDGHDGHDGRDGGAEDNDTPAFFKELEARDATPAKTPSKRPKTKVAALVKEKVRKVLEDVTDLAEQRARNMTENDFLKLLLAFHEEGIHFS